MIIKRQVARNAVMRPAADWRHLERAPTSPATSSVSGTNFIRLRISGGIPSQRSLPEPMPAPEPILSPELAALIELAGHPDTLRWAHECGWVPGTGHCRNRDCSTECLFQPQREAEARRIVRTRRRRRKPQDPAAAEGCRSPPGAADRGARGTG